MRLCRCFSHLKLVVLAFPLFFFFFVEVEDHVKQGVVIALAARLFRIIVTLAPSAFLILLFVAEHVQLEHVGLATHSE